MKKFFSLVLGLVLGIVLSGLAALTRQNKSLEVPETPDSVSISDTLKALQGSYEYPSDDASGKLVIERTDTGYDITDYTSNVLYRFMADSSNVEKIEENKIYMKYPEQIYSDDTVVWSYGNFIVKIL